jgi:anti-anti-sigma factor
MLEPFPQRTPLTGRITVDCRGTDRVLRLAGEIDAATVAAFEAENSGDIPGDRAPITVVDLADVTFLSSSAVSFLIRQTGPGRDRGQLPVLRTVAGPARRVLQLTGVDPLFRTVA